MVVKDQVSCLLPHTGGSLYTYRQSWLHKVDGLMKLEAVKAKVIPPVSRTKEIFSQ